MKQKLQLIGRLGADPELRYRDNGLPFAVLSVATNRPYTDAAGQRQKETAWFRVYVNGKLAETCGEYLRKGRLIEVEGRLIVDAKTGGPRVFVRQGGATGASFEVSAESVLFLPDGSGRGEAQAGGGEGAGQSGEGWEEEEIPF